MLDTAIVGGGLCGLAIASGLSARGDNFAVFEARPRPGGRILSSDVATPGLAVDLGPTWYWPDSQPRIARLIADLGLTPFAQPDGETVLHLKDPNAKPDILSAGPVHAGARRVSGGFGTVIAALTRRLPRETLHFGHVLMAVVDRLDHIELHFLRGYEPVVVKARSVVLAVPPRLLEERVSFAPALDAPLRRILRDTPTWMAGSAKAVCGFERPFWRDAGHTGNAFATHPQAVLGEVFDASDEPAGRAALGGFVTLPIALRESFKAGLPMLVRSQLVQLFGGGAERSTPHVHDWATETYTCSTLDHTPPDGHPEYGSRALRLSHWNDKLYFGSSETASYGGGYMEGALEAAGRILKELALDRALTTH
jgi:monoamine oxidase